MSKCLHLRSLRSGRATLGGLIHRSLTAGSQVPTARDIHTRRVAPSLTRADGSPLQVLVVDDEPNIAELLSMALRYEGWEVKVAHRGRKAVTVAKEMRPDAVALDMMLPDFDGMEVLRKIHDDSPDVPVLFLTARDSVEDRVAGLTAGGDDYVTKPFSLEEVVARLRALMRRSGALDDARVVDPDRSWQLHIPDEAVMTTGDEQRLHQAVTNLLTNASRHTAPGTVVTVTLTVGNTLMLTVHDNGAGISEELRSTIFERLTRGDSARTREFGGAGLGMSLVHAIVHAHGGTAAMTSEPGNTTFTLILPTDS